MYERGTVIGDWNCIYKSRLTAYFGVDGEHDSLALFEPDKALA